MYRVITVSFFFIIFYIITKALNLNNDIIELYRRPIQIFGALTYFLGLLIISSSFYDEFALSYTQRQIIFIGSLLLILFFSSFFNLPSLTNTAYVFAVLYLMEKNVDFFAKIKGGECLLVLSISIILWLCSLYLHKHSEIIISIFNGS